MDACISPSEILICSCKPPLIEGISRESKNFKNLSRSAGAGGGGESRQGLGRLTHRVKLYDLAHLFSEAHSENITAQACLCKNTRLFIKIEAPNKYD